MLRIFSRSILRASKNQLFPRIKLNFCTVQPNVQTYEFKAETKRLLEIVAKSLYTDKDVFIRELLSNASDALEKLRFMQESGRDTRVGEPLQILIRTDPDKKQIIIQDTGLGMSKEDLISYLGTIANSGSKKLVDQLKTESNNQSFGDGIIGQFGVGFYSSFIVGDSVEVKFLNKVISRQSKDEKAHKWVSDGSGEFQISEIEETDFDRGTKIIINLRPNCLQFSQKEEISKIIQRYSNFINYPIYINGEMTNLVKAIWSKSKRDVTEDEYTKFWEHFSNQKVNYKYKLHYSTDVPLQLKALLYIPNMHTEKYGMAQEEMKISLYSKKVLIKADCRELMPNFLRFVKGVVDCDDIPLNISRENYQDSMLMAKLKNIISKRVLKMLVEESERDEASYLEWYQEFQFFLKEGLASEPDYQDALLPLIRYNSNYTDKYVNIEDYLKKMIPNQETIYFILAPTRELALSSPYMEPFKNTKVPVLIVNMHVDEMVFRTLQQYKGKYKFVNVENSYDEIQKDIKSQEQENKGLPDDDITPFSLWLKNELQPIVNKVQISKRLTDSPAIVVGQLTSGLRQVMSMIDKQNVKFLLKSDQLDKNLTLEINPNHEIIRKLNEMRKTDISLASLIARQLLDNTMLSAGMVNDVKSVVNRINKLILQVFDSHSGENQNLKIDHEAQREAEFESIIQEMEQDKEFQKEQEKIPEEIIVEQKK